MTVGETYDVEWLAPGAGMTSVPQRVRARMTREVGDWLYLVARHTDGSDVRVGPLHRGWVRSAVRV